MKKVLLALAMLFAIEPAKANDLVQLTPDNTVVYNQVVDDNSVLAMETDLLSKVSKRGEADYPIFLIMNCPGGNIYSGEQFIQFAKLIPNLKTVTIFAASMCSSIVEALPGERLVTENGILMFHRAKGSFQGQFEEGEVESQLALWKSIVRSMEQRSANRMSMSLEDYKAKVKDELWIYGHNNVSTKAADRVVDLSCSMELYAQGCPLMSAPYSQGE